MGMFDILMNQEGLDPVKWDYNIDIIMCIDATGSMDPILDEVKKTALSFEGIFREAMESKGKMVDQLRVKVIAFRDYIIDSVPMCLVYNKNTQNCRGDSPKLQREIPQ